MYSFNNKVLSFYSLPGRMIPLLSGRVQFIRGGKSLNYKSLNRFSASGTWVSFRVVLKGNQELVSSCSPLPPPPLLHHCFLGQGARQRLCAGGREKVEKEAVPGFENRRALGLVSVWEGSLRLQCGEKLEETKRRNQSVSGDRWG